MTHPRIIEDSVRRKQNKRQRRREKLKAKKELMKKQKMEELARARNRKMKEIRDKLKEIQSITGNDGNIRSCCVHGNLPLTLFCIQL